MTKNASSAFNKFSDKVVSQVTFMHDYFELHLQDDYMRFMSETFIKTDNGEYKLPSMDANWYFYKLIGQTVTSIEENEKEIIVNFDTGWTITVNTTLEAPGDNFHIGGAGMTPLFI
jgi:hypothetical protein